MRKKRARVPDQLRLLGVMGGRPHARDRRRAARRGAPAIFGGLVGTSGNGLRPRHNLARILEQVSTDLAAGAVGVGVLIGYTPGSIRRVPRRRRTGGRRRGADVHPLARHRRIAPETLIDGAKRSSGRRARPARTCTTATSTRRRDDTSIECSRWSAAARPKVPASRRRRIRTGRDRRRSARRSSRRSACVSASEARPRSPIPHGRAIADEARLRELRATDPGGLVIAESSTRPNPATPRCCDGPWRFPTRSSPATACRRCGPTTRTSTSPPGHCRRKRSPTRAQRARSGAPCGCGGTRARRSWRRSVGRPCSCSRCSGRGPGDAPQGSDPGRRDADLVVFDEARVTDQATTSPPQAVLGIAHVIVGGTFVVRDGEPCPTRFREAGARLTPVTEILVREVEDRRCVRASVATRDHRVHVRCSRHGPSCGFGQGGL